MVKNAPENSPFTKLNQPSQDAITILIYGPMFLNIGALLGFIYLIDELGRMPFENARSAVNGAPLEFEVTKRTTVNIAMSSFSQRSWWKWADYSSMCPHTQLVVM